jgi:serine protease Do
MHEREDKLFAPKAAEAPRTAKGLAGPNTFTRGCMHCHEVREALNTELAKTSTFTRESVWRYPFPENIGLELEVDRGDTVKAVNDKSPAAAAGLIKGDVIQRLNGVPIHSFADVQYALDRAPREGAIEILWKREKDDHKEKLQLTKGWRKTDVSWRASMRYLLPSARLSGFELSEQEKRDLGLSAKQLAFRHREILSKQAEDAGIRPGDIILGVDDKPFEMDLDKFKKYVEDNYLVGDKVTVNLIRDGKREKVVMKLLK